MTARAPNPVDAWIDDGYLAATRCAGAYVRALSAGVLETLGLWRLAGAASLPQVAARLQVAPELQGALGWLLEEARRLGAVEVEEPAADQLLYRPAARCAAPAIAASVAELARHAGRIGSSREMLDHVAAAYPDFLRGARSGGAILFKGPALQLTTRYFSAANPLYDVHNQLGRAGVLDALRRLGRPARLLELGTGTGGGAAAVLGGLSEARPDAVSSFTITDIAPSFLLAAAERLGPANPLPAPLARRRLDFSRSPLAQGFAAGEVDVLFAVNALHNAEDLAAALAALRPLLADDGWLVLSESLCEPGEHVHEDFIFNLLPLGAAGRWRAVPTSRFLSAEEWERALGLASYVGELQRNSRGPQLALLALAPAPPPAAGRR